MKFDGLNRRTHLYLAIFLIPWFLMYGVSAIPFNHPAPDSRFYDDSPDWIARVERPYDMPLSEARTRDREMAAEIMKEFGIADVAYHTYRLQPRTMFVLMPKFLEPKRIIYYADKNKIVLQDKRFRWDQFLTVMHSRGGFQHDSLWDDVWAVTVDIVMVAILIWAASGTYMWWQVRSVRTWGFVALVSGFLSFLVFVFGM